MIGLKENMTGCDWISGNEVFEPIVESVCDIERDIVFLTECGFR